MTQVTSTPRQRFRERIMRTKTISLRAAIVVLVLLAIVLVCFLIQNYNQPWTGFGPRLNADGKIEPGRTFWDWLELLIIPLVLAFAVVFFNRSERRTEQRIAQVRDETTRRIAADDRHEKELQAYFDRMTDLLLKEKLLDTSPESEIRTVARARSLTVLRSLDADRGLAVLRFLREISKGRTSTAQAVREAKSLFTPDGFLFSMKDAYLPMLSPRADLSGTYLRGIWITKADLRGIDFSDADLFDSLLSEANLIEAKLVGANLNGTNLFKASLSRASLAAANMCDTLLSGADLSGCDFFKATLSGAFLAGAKLTEVESLSPKQLAGVAMLVGATMPNGLKWQGSPEGPYTIEELKRYFPESPISKHRFNRDSNVSEAE